MEFEKKDERLKSDQSKYLTFHLSSEEYGLEILKVQEIIGMMPITRMPKMPDYIRGIINLRGKLIPVINMREKFSFSSQEDTEKTCIIVIQTLDQDAQMTVGILVDRVSEVIDISQKNIEPPPVFGSDIDTQYILGIGKVREKVVILLDIDKILKGAESLTQTKNALT